MHTSLALSVTAVRELMEEALHAPGTDAAMRRTMRLALEALEALWGAIEARDERNARDERELAGFFEAAPDPCLITDANGRVRHVNAAAAELLRVPAGALLHRPIASLLAAEQYAQVPIHLRELMTHGEEGRATRWRSAVGGPDGPVAVEVSVGEMGRASGRVTGLCWLLRPLAPAAMIAVPLAATPPQRPKLPQTPR